MNRNRVFLPLRSNVGWFQSVNLKNMISNRVKEAILIYDELYIEDGTFQATILEDGELAIDLGLGITSFIPGYGILPTSISITKSIHKYLEDKSGWLGFLLRLGDMEVNTLNNPSKSKQ